MAGIHVGVIGAGLIGKDHANSLHRQKLCGQVTIFDEDQARAQSVASGFGLKTASSLEALMDAVDIVWIAAPPFVHRKLVEAACAKKKAIFCEKPLAHNAADAQAIAKAVKKARVPFYMGQSGRFTSTFVLIDKLVREGLIGKPLLVWSTRQGRLDPSKSPPWRLRDDQSGGAIVELGVHEVDYINWIGGTLKSVTALGDHSLIGKKFQDSVVALGQCASGARARIDLSWANPRYLWERGVHGTKGDLYYNDQHFKQILFTPIDGSPSKPYLTTDTDWMDRTTGENLSLREQAKAILEAHASRGKPPVPLQAGLDAVIAALAIRESAYKKGKAVKVNA